MKKKVSVSERSITKDIVFGHVMSKPKNCLQLLQRILPHLNITWVRVKSQEVLDEGAKEKGVRLDIMARDDQGRLYDIEMQVARQEYIGKRIRYYQSQIDKNALNRGKDYVELADSYVIFLCPYDPFYHNLTRYEFSVREDHDPNIKLETGAHWIFLNSKGSDKDINRGLQQFLDLMNGVIDDSDAFIAHLNQEIDDYVGSNEWRDDKMKLIADMQDSKREGIRQGKLEGMREEIKNSIDMMRECGSSDDIIFDQIKKRHPHTLSDKEIRKLMEK